MSNTNNNDDGRRQIGFHPPGFVEQSIVQMVPAQVVRSALSRAFWVGLAIGALIVFLVMRPSAPTA